MIKTVSEATGDKFEKICNGLVTRGYKILSASCGFINSADYEFADVWQAILEKD